jgi:phosphate transport system permease protein
VTTVATESTPSPAEPGREDIAKPSLLKRMGSFSRQHEEGTWRWAGRVAAALPLVAVVFVVTVLVIKAVPAIRVNGFNFLTHSGWNPGNTYGATVHTHGVAHPLGSDYGAWSLILGTIQTSAIAVVVALPLSVCAAFALTERLPRWITRPLGIAIDILAGIPSVVIGLWGILTFGPWLAHHVYPHIAAVMPDVPVLRYFRAPTGSGEGLLSTGLILALMIVPIITATTRDLFLGVPPLPKEGAEALGMTDWEVARRVTMRWVSAGIIGATVLGLARALGETIAVALVSGSIIHVAPNIYSPMTTIAATIVTQLDSAATDGTGFAVATLAEAALVLAVISVVVNTIGRGIVSRTGRTGAPLGRA